MYGTGSESNETNVRRSYEQAKDEARAIVDAGKNFYTIAAFGNVTRMSNLTAFAYSGTDTGTYPAGHYQEADDSASLQAAFNNIVSRITKDFHYADVAFTDTLTPMTSSRVVNGEVTDFTYTVTDADGAPVEVTAAGDNTYTYTNGEGQTKTFHGAVCDSTGRITWNMDVDDNTPFLLDGGYTYTVSFDVWPSQEAYDLVADLNNSTRSYEDLTDDEKRQITKEGDTYKLKTNEEGTKAEYKTVETRTENGETTVSYGDTQTENIPNPDPVDLTGTYFTVTKIWDDDTDSSDRPESITLNLIRDKGTEEEVTVPVTLTGEEQWSATVYIAPGLIADGEKLNDGHTYDIEEVSSDNRYELDTETYRPFLIDSSTLIYNGEAKTVDGKSMQITTLSATNHLRGAVQLEKRVIDSNGQDITTVTQAGETVVNPAIGDVTFTFSMTLVSPGEHSAEEYRYAYFDQTAYGGEEATYEKAITETDGIVTDCSVSYDEDEDLTTLTAAVTLKPQEQFRMVNLPIGTTCTFTEEEKTGYAFDHAVVNDGEAITDPAGITSTVTADHMDRVVVTNRAKKLDLQLTKTDDASPANLLTGAEFSLKRVVTDDNNGEREETAYTMDGTAVDAISIDALEPADLGDLPSGTYRLIETKAPAGYSLAPEITFMVDRSKIGTAEAVQLISGGGASVSFDADSDTCLITVRDAKIYELPSAGGYGAIPFTTAGVVLMIAAAFIFAASGISRKEGHQ